MAEYSKLNKFMVEKFLLEAGIQCTSKETENLGNISERFVTEIGHINFFTNGSINTGGKGAGRLRELLDYWNSHIKTLDKTIFIDYAFSNSEKKDEIQKLLSQWGFKTIVMEDQPGNDLTLISKLEECVSQAHYGVVLLSPDVQLENGLFHARPNVMLEIGLLLGYLKDEDKRLTLINYSVEGKSVEIPSGIIGMSYLQYNQETIAHKLMKEVYHLYNFTY